MKICSKITGWVHKDNQYILAADTADIMVCYVTDNMVRLHASFDRSFREESYCLMAAPWEDRMDKLFEGERRRLEKVQVTVEENPDEIHFISACMTLRVMKTPLQIFLYDNNDMTCPLYATLAGNPFVCEKSGRITAYSRMNEDDCFYGFGEKTGTLNKNKKYVRERATDAMGYDATTADTLYKHIPFYITLQRGTSRAMGMFFHNFYESAFNMGCEKSNYRQRYSYWQADGGDIDVYLIGGNTFRNILDSYTLLTGRPALLPKRALGYQGSSMFYSELSKDSDKAVLDFTDIAREEGFPLDGFHLSSGYTTQNDKRCVFTWNNERFPDAAEFMQQMNERNISVVPNVKPGVLLCHPEYDRWTKENVFIKDSEDINQNAVGEWWGGKGVFWDFTSQKAREVWKEELTKNVLDYGTDCVWNDNCEYDSIMDTDSRCDFDGEGGSVAQLKPIMSTLMCKMAAEAVTAHNPNARPYIVCRSGSAGIQHYAQTWAGDNYTSWETLRYNIPTITGMGLSGQPNEGADIGGFAGNVPEKELFVRWVQQGIFQPRFSIHSASSDNTVTEPWMYPEATNLIRDAIRLRYSLVPYLYSAEYNASINGAPIMRALVYDFQEDSAVYDESFTYMFGEALLVANVIEKGAVEKTIYLPAGCKWYDWNDNFRCYEGGQTICIPVQLSSVPMFMREGTAVTMAKNDIMNMEHDHVTDLLITLSPGKNVNATLYDDDGYSEDYRRGIYLKTVINTEHKGNAIEISFTREGSYKDYADNIALRVISKECVPDTIILNIIDDETHTAPSTELKPLRSGRRFSSSDEGWHYNQSDGTVEIKYANPRKNYSIKIIYPTHDLIGM